MDGKIEIRYQVLINLVHDDAMVNLYGQLLDREKLESEEKV